MGTELVAMSTKELERLEVVRRVLEGRLTQAKAGEFIGLSEHQVRRLCAAFEERGPAGLVSGKRGQPSNRRLPDELRSHAIEIVRERYADFGPTLACEKLLELHDVRVSKETLRAWLIGAGTLVSSCRSMGATTPGSRTGGRAARSWCTSTTRPVA
jgi:transposase